MEGVMQHRMRDQDQSSEFTMKDAMDDASRVIEALGPMPREVLEAMVDYGLNDVEISRYFKLPRIFIPLREGGWRVECGQW
jgi:hypothetical protein